MDVKLYKPINGSKNHTGELIGLVDNNVQIRINEKIIEFKWDEVAIVRLTVDF